MCVRKIYKKLLDVPQWDIEIYYLLFICKQKRKPKTKASVYQFHEFFTENKIKGTKTKENAKVK